MNERATLEANLTATQARCTELLDESRAKGREIVALKAANAFLTSGAYDLSERLEAERRAKTEAQAQTTARLRAIGYRVKRRCGSCVSLAFTRE